MEKSICMKSVNQLSATYNTQQMAISILAVLKKYHTLFFSKIRKDVANFAVCCSYDCPFKVNIHTYQADI